MHPKPIQHIAQLLKKLPGVGPKTAQRYAYALKSFSQQDLEALIQNLSQLKKSLTNCERCQLTIETKQGPLCSICRDPRRDQKLLCLVADEQELEAMEQTNFSGVYFVLGGLVRPRAGENQFGPHLKALKKRIKTDPPREIILALSPTSEGAATLLLLKKELAPLKIPITRLGMGLPSEADLRYADKQTLESALANRAPF